MDIIERPFETIRAGDIARPILPVIIKNPQTSQQLRTIGLIDTGADECAFPAVFASMTGHDLFAGQRKEISTGNGITTAYTHTVSLEINDYKFENILVDFMPDLNISLPGVKNFLKEIVLNINYQEQHFSLKSR